MSIEAEITDRVRRGMLFPLIPKAAGATVRRALFVGEELWHELNGPITDDQEWEERVGKLRADLEVFVTEKSITPKYLFLLFPSKDGVWEIRSARDKPSLRVLGLFASRDVFISTNFARREDLQGWQDRTWKDVKRLAKTIWRKLFFTHQPVVTINVSDVCSGASNDIFYKDRT